jgi:hypothetical protein
LEKIARSVVKSDLCGESFRAEREILPKKSLIVSIIFVEAGMIAEYGALLGANGFFSSLASLPNALINFLYTREGQIAAVVMIVVLFFLFGRKN